MTFDPSRGESSHSVALADKRWRKEAIWFQQMRAASSVESYFVNGVERRPEWRMSRFRRGVWCRGGKAADYMMNSFSLRTIGCCISCRSFFTWFSP